MKKRNLSFFMINNSNLANSKFIKTEEVSRQRNLPIPGFTEAVLYIKRATAKMPTSTEFFADYVPASFFGESVSPGSALVLRYSNRVFVLTFGQGRHLIKQQHLVLDFGLCVVLNSVEADQIRSVDQASNGNTPLNSRNQSLDSSDLFRLLFDPEQDIAAAITGTSKGQYFDNSIISGRDSFNISTKTNPEEIKPLLDRIYERHQSHTYKENFSFIDDIKRIRVVYVIVSEKEGALDIPFFSKVTLKNAYKKLDAMGYKVGIAKIDIKIRMKATKKYREKSQKLAA